MSYKISFHHNAELEYEHAWNGIYNNSQVLKKSFSRL